VLLDAAAEVREIIRFMRDFERAATVEATARDSWRHLNTLASEQDAIADQLSASCDELRNTKNRLSSALHISSTELAAAFAKARAAPMQPATGTPNERHTAEYLASVMPKPLSPTTACTSGPAADRSPTQTFLSDLPTLTTKASSTIELSDQGSRGKQRSAMPKPARTRGLPAARLVLAIACFLALVFLLTALIAST
jgi:predicted DNA-binding ribbon-helix-helix protein